MPDYHMTEFKSNKSSIRKNSTYKSELASAYDRLMRSDYSYLDYADYIVEMFSIHGISDRSLVADLGCGTGTLCRELARRGYDMIGIDNSSEMLSRAHENSGNILFLEQDIHRFELYGTVASFISTIDSLNYITDKRSLSRVFRLVENYLDPGGLFIFDINTPHRLENIFGANQFYYVTDDFCYLWQSKHSRGISTLDLTFFTLEEDTGLWRRDDEIHRQRAWRDQDILAASAATTLSLIGKYSFLGITPPRSDAEKVNYIFQKPHGKNCSNENNDKNGYR